MMAAKAMGVGSAVGSKQGEGIHAMGNSFFCNLQM
jgi:hypothetical protein